MDGSASVHPVKAELPDAGRIFAAFNLAGRASVVAAVSGGSDSLGLLLLLEEFLDRQPKPPQVVAVTVDHGLRPESAGEAEAVAAICDRLGVRHRIMRWTGDKPSSGLSAAAREARYRLLAAAADREGTDIVLTGHTLDDQLETVAMRRARGDGRGLAGMAPATLFCGHSWILRPLLGIRRSALRDHLKGHGLGWIDDPTNADSKYERARLRAAGIEAAHRFDAPAAPEIAAAAAGRIALGEAAADLIAAHARLVSPGLVRLDRGFVGTCSTDAAVYALRILLAVMGGVEQLPDRARVAALSGKLGDPAFRATLSRTIVEGRRAGIFLHRERRGLPEPTTLREGMIWDGRYRIGSSGAAGWVLIAPLGSENARQAQLPGIIDAPESLARAALACEPAALSTELDAGSGSSEAGQLRGEQATGRPIAAREGLIAKPIVAPWARFLPSFDLAPARAVAALLGADPPQAPPLAGHNMRKA
jgi:tRNA(Ile)-lysidine synthase